MSECLPCGKVTAKEQNVVKYYKSIFKKTGGVYYAYRLSEKDSFKFVMQKHFSEILENQIKPNFINGAEYYHIQEFKG